MGLGDRILTAHEKSKMKSGIYIIKNTVNGKVYIGSSTNVVRRRQTHFAQLRKNKHHNPHLQSAFNKYGKDSFEYAVLQYCSVEELIRIEDFYINHYRAMDRERGYNTNTAERHTLSEETKKKISLSLMGNRNPNFNKRLSIEYRTKISNSLIGSRNPNFHKHLSKSHREKISASVSLAMKGIPKSEAHKKSLSMALKGKFKKPHLSTP